MDCARHWLVMPTSDRALWQEARSFERRGVIERALLALERMLWAALLLTPAMRS